ncbi:MULTISPECIES: hypothetical protein [Bacillus]|uniref:hypothetical protein n=1 Tax=Bacillus TaxID=1386 RepID=UPI001CCE2422|nr:MULTISPECIES: hypothetical protein [Bacillus]MCM8509569.1 hypothetical protein [Bacillus amyloliquefaciens]MCR6608228.1 hypothetical protein [Bacillus velezensis]MCR6614988.1 hypothetical protein [Bacillus amyloliquefaciens]MCU9591128.1 hypothetical protein [Bacillus velezensis]MCV2523914.1 hypothetical protein [Bacillus velezensis]
MELERLVIAAGSQQDLHILSVMPFPNGKKKVLIESSLLGCFSLAFPYVFSTLFIS